MGIIGKFFLALEGKDGFKMTWKRLTHMESGHPFDLSEKLDSFKTEKHPHSDDTFIYAINMRKCNDCGLIYFDNGLEFRK